MNTCKRAEWMLKIIAAGLFLVLAGCGDQSPVQVESISYLEWDGGIEVSNAETRLVVVPAIGRIMHYSKAGGENLLWTNPEHYGETKPAGDYLSRGDSVIWANFGGDKVWPTPQDLFEEINGRAWPPDPWFDGARHEFERLKNGVRLISPVSDYCGAQVTRTIRLAESGSRVTIHQELTKRQQAQDEAVEPIPHTIWSVTQIRNPEEALFRLNPDSHLGQRYAVFPFEPRAADNFYSYDNLGVFIPDSIHAQKVGADSDKWLAAIIGHTVFGQFFDRQQNATYPEGDLGATVYTSPAYTELELLSPLQELKPGESMEYTIAWDITTLDTVTGADQRRQTAMSWLEEQATIPIE
ncbi:MAG: DUF4380 domain-containing protein [Candidatus Marinimicrobia bacterium]|nr:DUF4380 domain-containing protein [Candidatus Neomarinimicrobiota bacterium]